MPTPLTPDRVTPLFRSTFGTTYRHLTCVSSTQDEFLDDDPEGTVVACEEQRAGRGRRGQEWVAPLGRALLFSILLRPGPARPAAQIALVAGVLVAAVLERELGIPVGIKWPNDVIVGRAKIAGILVEQRGEAVVVGVGVNVNQTRDELPEDARLAATSLRVVNGRSRDRADLLARIVAGLESGYASWRTSGLEAITDEFERRDVLRGRQVRVGTLSGVAAGIATDGALLINTADGLRSVVAGSVEVAW